MGKIRVLPEILAHKIAAGEIVERPASVVKELVENSIDADASQVSVDVLAGGKKLIAVKDDGIGMSAEDAALAFQHHATSKIESFEDLTQIQTLGFRGEALPSIASVSRLTVRTIERTSSGIAAPLGTLIEFEGGKRRSTREVTWPKGTEIRVEDLFFNVPARRKFLKSDSTEISHINRQVTHYSLAYPEVEFRLQHQDRLLLEVPAVESLQDRVFQVMGEAFLENLVPIHYEKEGVTVTGFTSLPHEQRSNTRSQYLFVNRRVVRDKVVTHAIRLAYRDLIPSSSHPVVLLFVDLDPTEVDVNVHPSKTEIRFRDSQRVHSAIYHGLEEALIRNQTHLGSLARDVPFEQMRTAESEAGRGIPRSVDRFFQRHPDSSMGFREFRNPAGTFLPPPYSADPPFSQPGTDSRTDPHRFDIPETAYLSPVPTVLGQFVESFVVAADREGVMLIDQHVAHERVLYDQAQTQLDSGQSVPTQRLLMPLTVELSADQTGVLSEGLEELNRNGFEVEWFGSRTIVVKGVPEVAVKCGDAGRLLQEILDDLRDLSPRHSEGTRIQRLREKVAVSLSCRAAIKINTPLSSEKMQWLIDALFRCQNPYTCPHGRPIVLRLGIEDVLRGFKRI